MSTTVRYLMTTPVVTVRPGTPFKDIVAAVRAARVGAVPVTDEAGQVIGIVSERDLLIRKASPARAVLRASLRHRSGQGEAAATAAGLMISPAVTIRAEATPKEAARLMRSRHLPSLPVVDVAGRLIGIVSQGDVLDTFTRPDTAIRREVIQRLIWREFLLDPDVFTVTVENGIVTLTGRPENDLVGHCLAAAVADVEGVVAVHDRLSYTAERARRSWR